MGKKRRIASRAVKPSSAAPSSDSSDAPKGSRFISWLILAGLVVAAGAFVVLLSDPGLEIDHTDSKAVDIGRRIYSDACASCHGAKLEGQKNWTDRMPNGRLPAPPHDASGHTWHHTDEALFQITKRGPAAYPKDYPTDMPAFADRLTDKEIAAVIAFIKSTWPPDILRRQHQVNSRPRSSR